MTDREYLQRLGARIKKIRLKKKMSQIRLATLCNFEASNLARIESGRTNPSARTLRKIAVALQTPVKYLFDF